MKIATKPELSSCLIILRETQSRYENFRVLMLKRNSNLSFGNTYAFPGGKVESADFALADQLQNSIHQSHANFYFKQFMPWYPASLINCLRETEEETGIKVNPSQQINNLRPFIRLITPQIAKRRYDTQFLVLKSTDLKQNLDDLIINKSESQSYLWETPSLLLEKFINNEILIAPPIMFILFILRKLSNIDAIFNFIHSQEKIQKFKPFTFPIIFSFNGNNIIIFGDQEYDYRNIMDLEQNTRDLQQELEYYSKNLSHDSKFRANKTLDNKSKIEDFNMINTNSLFYCPLCLLSGYQVKDGVLLANEQPKL